MKKISIVFGVSVFFFSSCLSSRAIELSADLAEQQQGYYHSILDRDFTVLAHRGGLYDDAVENTYESFKNAVDIGVDIIETDLHLTSDGVVVAFHDSSIDRVSESRGKIAWMTYSQLLDVDLVHYTTDNLKVTGKIISFEQLLEEFPNTIFNVDMKARSNKLVESVGKILERHQAFDRVCVASFFTANIELFRKLYPFAVTSFSTSEFLYIHQQYKRGRDLKQKDLPAFVLQVPHKLWGTTYVDRGFVEYVHRHGILIHVWTINCPEEMRYLIEIGVDGIVTDFPSLCFEVLNTL
ncbi:MAG: hypothetical protein JXR63_05740 [Spirochaetales bacterium]|nr:hypothetical protein [Spirochaetales bacterium]